MPGSRPHHTDKWRSCVADVQAKGHTEQSAAAICTAQLGPSIESSDTIPPGDAEHELSYKCDCGAEMCFAADDGVPSRCADCGRDVDVRKVGAAEQLPAPVTREAEGTAQDTEDDTTDAEEDSVILPPWPEVSQYVSTEGHTPRAFSKDEHGHGSEKRGESHPPEAHVADRIQAHLSADKHNAVMISTPLKTIGPYTQQHAGMFRKPMNGDAGVHVQHGKGSFYARPETVRFGKMTAQKHSEARAFSKDAHGHGSEKHGDGQHQLHVNGQHVSSHGSEHELLAAAVGIARARPNARIDHVAPGGEVTRLRTGLNSPVASSEARAFAKDPHGHGSEKGGSVSRTDKAGRTTYSGPGGTATVYVTKRDTHAVTHGGKVIAEHAGANAAHAHAQRLAAGGQHHADQRKKRKPSGVSPVPKDLWPIHVTPGDQVSAPHMAPSVPLAPGGSGGGAPAPAAPAAAMRERRA